MAGDLLDHRVVLAQCVAAGVAGLRLATAHVAAVATRAEVEGAAALLARVGPRRHRLRRCVPADRLLDDRRIDDLHGHKVLRVKFATGIAASLRRLVIPPIFVIELRGGSAVVRSGEPPAGLIAELAQTARDLGLANGNIYAVRGAHGATLEFSTDIPEHAHQRLRNVFGVHRHRIKG